MGVGLGTMLGYGIGAVKEQFKTPESNNNSNNNNSSSGFKGFVDRAKEVINPRMNLSDSKDYDGNTNPIQNVVPKENTNRNVFMSIPFNKENTPNGVASGYQNVFNNRANGTEYSNITNAVNSNNSSNKISNNDNNQRSVVGRVAQTGLNATKEYLKMGAKLTEGDFGRDNYRNLIPPRRNNQNINNNFKTDYTNNLEHVDKFKNFGGDYEE